MYGKRAFITGLEGFTGHYLKNELRQAGYEVLGVTKPGSSTFEDDLIHCDINNLTLLRAIIKDFKPNYIVNLAGISFVEHAKTADLHKVNHLGVITLLNAILQSKHLPEKILLPSTAHVYGNQKYFPITENIEPSPTSDYAISKYQMEQSVQNWFQKFPLIIVRPFNYTGAGQSNLFLPAKLVEHFVQKAPSIELGNLQVARDWSDVRDVVGIYRLLLESESAGLMVNVSSGKCHTLQSVIDTLNDLSGHQLQIKTDPALMRANEIMELSGDNSLLHSIVGSVKYRSLDQTLGWMLENKNLV